MQRQCVWFDAPRQVCVRDESLNEIADDHVLVQTRVSAISAGTEMLFYCGQVSANLPVDVSIAALSGEMRYPLRYGYACVGRVMQIGARVPGEWLHRTVFAFQPHASHFVARVDELLPVPESISPERAALLPNMETAVNFVMDAAPVIGERAVVLGQGVVGLLTTALLAQMPLAQLVTFDRFEKRRTQSCALGASEAFDPQDADAIARARGLLQSDGADVTFELSGNPHAIDLAIALTGFAGRIVIGSWYGAKRAPIDLGGKFHRSRIQLMASQVSTIAPAFSARWTKARRINVAWLMLARLPLDNLITHRFALVDAARAYELLDQQPAEALQVLLTYDN